MGRITSNSGSWRLHFILLGSRRSAHGGGGSLELNFNRLNLHASHGDPQASRHREGRFPLLLKGFSTRFVSDWTSTWFSGLNVVNSPATGTSATGVWDEVTGREGSASSDGTGEQPISTRHDCEDVATPTRDECMGIST